MAGMSRADERLSILLSCYLDGELSREELAEVVQVLESDLDAIAEFRRLQTARRALRTLPTLNVPMQLLPGGHPTEELSAYLDGELATAELPIVTRHLDTCAECRAELADLDRARIAVRALPGLEAPSFLEVHREIREHRSRRLAWPAAVAAGGIAAAIIAVSVGFGSGGDAPVAVDIADLQTRHSAVASTPSGLTAIQVSTP